MMPSNIFLLTFLIGVVAGLRSMTAPAAVSWGARLGWLALAGSPLGFFGYRAFLILFTICALGELIADKLPFVPSRTTPGPLIFRLISGAACGAALCVVAKSPLLYGVLLGAAGALLGSYGGYNYRRLFSAYPRAVQFFAAVLEDVVAVGCGFWTVSRF